MTDNINVDAETIMHVITELSDIYVHYESAYNAMVNLEDNRYFLTEITNTPFSNLPNTTNVVSALVQPLRDINTAVGNSFATMLETDDYLMSEFVKLLENMG